METEPECVTTNDGRMVRGRHSPTCDSPGDCVGCQPCLRRHCIVCRREHVEWTCPSCLSVARLNLTTVLRLSGDLAGEAVDGRRALHVGEGVPGGDALVLLSPGADFAGWSKQLTSRRLRGLSVDHVHEERRDDPRPPAAVLGVYVPRWVADDLADVGGYLDLHLHELARTLPFVALHRDLVRIVRQLEDVLSDGDRLDVSRVPCWECGARLVKAYADTPRDDHWTCPRCHERYDRGRFERAKVDHLASGSADRYVYVSDAAAVVGRPRATVWQWVKDGRAASQRDASSGRTVVWWPDVRALHTAAQERRQAARERKGETA